MISAPVGFQCPECVRQANRGSRARSTPFGGRVTMPGPVTWSLVALNVAVFVLTSISGHRITLYGAVPSPLYRDFALIPPAVAEGQTYRLLTSAFLHYGLLHIFFNMYALVIIGPAVEATLGRWRYLALYLLSGVGGSLLTVWLAAPETQAAGASGAIFGLFGALFVVLRRMNRSTQQIVIVIVINLVLSFSIPNIAWEGHVGGLIVGTGLAAAWIATARQPAGRLTRHLALLVGVAIALSAVGVLAVHAVRSACAARAEQQNGGYCSQYLPSQRASLAAAAHGRRRTVE